MLRKLLTTPIAFLFCFCALSVFAQHKPATGLEDKYRIGISTGAFVPTQTSLAEVRQQPRSVFGGTYFKLIQFLDIPGLAERKIWKEKGLLLSDYLPGNLYFATINESFDWAVLQGKIRAVLEIDGRFKKEADLYLKGIPAHAISGNKAKLIVSYHLGVSVEDVLKDLVLRDAILHEHRAYARQVDVDWPLDQFENLVALPYVQFVGAVLPPKINEADNLAYRNTSSKANFLNTGNGGLNYNGSGVVIDIGEGGTVDNKTDFKGRLTELVSDVISDHKTGCTNNASGSGNADPTSRSCAWGATILSTDNENYPSLIATYNARYFNHSYGYGIGGGYNSSTRSHDLRTATNPNHLVSYSSGNNGTDVGYAPYSFANWGTITGHVKHNKNHLSVRNLSPNDEILDWGSIGPAYDGRLLPQITISGPEGTSYASPKAVGTFAILEQAYKANHAGAESPATLLKGIILNTADDMDNPGPDFQTGYGRPNVRRAYSVITGNQHLSSSVAHGATNTHPLVIPANTRQVRVMLIWPDAAAAVNANPCIVNNLNLVGKNPSNVSYNPWVLDHTPNPVNLVLPATRGVDNLNTVEQVTVDNPAAGTWNFEVSGANVPSGPQTYFLVYEYISDGLYMGYPLSNERFISGDNYYIKWDSYGDVGTFSLEYRLNGGSWTSIVSGLGADIRSYPWTAPLVSGVQTLEFRVKRGALIAASGINYIGSTPENLRVSVACGSSVTLKWSPVTGATSYKVYRLATQYMEEVVSGITFSGNSATLTGQSTTGSEFYAVSAVTGVYEGQRCMTIEKTVGDVGCTGISWTGATSTDWFIPTNWAGGIVPTSADPVIITSVPLNQPSISAAGAVCGTITIGIGASLTMSNSTAYTLSVWGDWINNGTFNRGIGTVDFAANDTYQEISGTSTSTFYTLKITKTTQSGLVEATALIGLTGPANPLVLSAGTFKLSSTSTISPFTTAAGANLTSSSGIWNNGGTINLGNFSWFNNAGLMRVSAGTINAGSTSNNTITYLNNGQFIVTGGALNVSGRIRPNSGTSAAKFIIQGGTFTVNTVGSTSTTEAALQVNPNASFQMNAGTLAIQRATSNTGADIVIQSTSTSVSGGTVQVGNASTPAGQTMRINSVVPLFNLRVNATNSPTAQIHTSSLAILNDVTIAGGTLNANNLNLTLGGSWSNNGTFTPGSGTVTLNGTANQDIGGTSSTTFNNLTVNNPTGISLLTNTSVANTLNLTTGNVTLGNQNLTLNLATGLSGGSSTAYMVTNGTGLLRRTIGAAGSYLFPVGSATAYNPASLVWAAAPGVTRLDMRYIETTPSTGTGLPQALGNLTVSGLMNNGYWDFAIGSGALLNNFDVTLTRNGLTNAGTVLNQHGLVRRTNSASAWSGAGNWTNPGATVISPANTGQVSITQTGVAAFGEMAMGIGIYCVPPTLATISVSETSGLANNDAETCGGASVTISVSAGNLNNATAWEWYSGSCGGTPVGTGTSVSVNPSTTTTYFVRGEGGCVSPGSCSSSAITVHANPSTPVITANETTGSANNDGIICSGTGVSLTGPAGMSSYTWSHLGGSAQTSALFSPAINTLYTLTVGNASGCTATNTFNVQVVNCSGTLNVWKGNSADWNDPANWSNGSVPAGCSENVRIPKRTFDPVVNAPVSVSDLEIQNQAGIVLNAALSICGNLVGGSPFLATLSGNSELVFTGSAPQQMTGNLAMTNFRVNKSAGSATIVNGRVQVTGSVFMPVSNQAGLVTTPSGNLTLVSNAAGTGRIDALLGGTLSGNNFTVERYVNGGTAGWYFAGTSVAGQALGDWGDDFKIVTPLSCTGTLTDLNLDRNTVYRHVETAVPANGTHPLEVNGWRAPASCLVNPGSGFRVFLDTPFFGNGGTFKNTGSLTTGPHTFTVTHTPGSYDGGGWNLLANPYPSNINWDAPTGWTKTNLQNAVYSWVGADSHYGSYVAGIGTNGVTGTLASGQAFFVHALAAPALSINENAKTATTQAMLRTAVDRPVLRMQVNGAGQSDEAVIHIEEQATDQFDSEWDAAKMENPGLSLATLGGEQAYSIQGIGVVEQDKLIPVSIKTPTLGTHSLLFSGVSTLTGISIWLKDHFLNTMYPVSDNQTFSLDVTADPNTQGAGRFELLFQNSVTKNATAQAGTGIRLYPNPTSGAFALLETGDLSGKLVMTDVAGRTIWSTSIAALSGAVKLPKPATPGMYTLIFETGVAEPKHLRWVVE